jgi:hypothetical protein
MVRWEVWVKNADGTYRFNACFETKTQADDEAGWYKQWGYETDIRVRTTRYQQMKYRTYA